MDFTIPDRMRDVLARVRAVMDAEAHPLELELARTEFRELLPRLRAARERVRAAGLWCPQLATEWGGMGLDFREHGLVSEALGRSPVGHYLFNCQAPDAGNMEVLEKYGTRAQKERWLGPLARGEIRSCFSMTEPERSGANPTWLGTRAVLDGDHWVIDGKKWFTTAADGAGSRS
jgi:acyl-CoA dehydrogenase